MTVQELIYRLQDLDPSLPVLVPADYGDATPVVDVVLMNCDETMTPQHDGSVQVVQLY